MSFLSIISIYKKDTKLAILFIFCLSLIVRLIAFWIKFSFTDIVNTMGPDHIYYLNLGREFFKYGVLNSTHISMPKMGLIFVGPFHPLLMGLFDFLFGGNWLPIFIFNIILSSFLPVVIFQLGLKLHYEKAGFLAALFSIFYRYFITSAFNSGKDLYNIIFFLLLLVLIIDLAINNKKRILWFGILFGISMHHDERFLILGPVFFIFLFVSNRKFKFSNWRMPIKFFSIVFIMMIPWGIRNYIVFDNFVLLTPRLSGFIDPILGQPNNPDVNCQKQIDNIFVINQEQIDSILQGTKVNYEYTYCGRDRTIKPIPVGAIELLRRGIIPHRFASYQQIWDAFKSYFWQIRWNDTWGGIGYTYKPKISTFDNIITILQYVLLLPFALIGYYCLFRKDRLVALILLLPIVIYSLANILTISYIDQRYRWPIDGVIILVSFIGVLSIYKPLQNRHG